MENAEWPSAVVALGNLALITAVGITAIVKYNVEQALKIWGALAGITGVVTGAFVTYFFTRRLRTISARENVESEPKGESLP